MRIVIADLRFQSGDFCRRDVGRIGDQEIEGEWECDLMIRMGGLLPFNETYLQVIFRLLFQQTEAFALLSVLQHGDGQY